MEWRTIATLALGIGSIVAGSLIPQASAVLLPAGAALLGLAAPQPKTWFAASDPKALPKVEEPPK